MYVEGVGHKKWVRKGGGEHSGAARSDGRAVSGVRCERRAGGATPGSDGRGPRIQVALPALARGSIPAASLLRAAAAHHARLARMLRPLHASIGAVRESGRACSERAT